MRYAALPALAVLGLLLALSGCADSRSSATVGALPGTDTSNPLAAATLMESSGNATAALGIYWLERDPSAPLDAALTMSRQLTAQGDLYGLSLRPFMNPQSLRIIGTSAGPNNTTDYEVRFTHPFSMPTDLVRPSSAAKRVDLFIFDVQTVLVTQGTDRYFSDSLQLNTNAMRNADGYRQFGPLLDPVSLGIADGANTFPYRLMTNADHGNPAGNYSPTAGWVGDVLLAPTGYDVLPQGASATSSLRVDNALTGPIAAVVVAKYMDPRNGLSAVDKRANRLPDPADTTQCAYFLPEASGDLQSIGITVAGTLHQGSDVELATVTAHVLDWDNAAPLAGTFPDYAMPNAISELSKPIQIELSVPQLQSSGPFIGTVGPSSGLRNEFVDLTIPVRNIDRTYSPLNPAGDALVGLLRIQDTQDLSAPAPFLLDESLVGQPLPPGFKPSARYQLVHITITSGPQVTSVAPLGGLPGQTRLLSAVVENGPVTNWAWNFGGGATPNTSTLATPSIVLGEEGSYDASVTVSSASGESTFQFVMRPAMASPTLPPTLDNYANQPLPRHYTDPNYPAGIIVTSDNTPPTNQITNAGATLGRVLFYDLRLSKNNTVSCASCHQQASGFSDPAVKSIGFDGGSTGRHSMGLANARYYQTGRAFWDERAATLEEQALMPIQDGVEMGMTLPELETKLARAEFYPALFQAAFGDPAITSDRVARALAQFVRSMVSYRTKFDQGMAAGPNGTPNFQAVFTQQELLGLAVFQGFPGITAPNMQCNQCHSTAAMTSGAAGAPPPGPPPGPFAVNNGLDLMTGADAGAGDGRFKSPSLRNIARTAPYMHDGRFQTLEQVIDFYAQGVQPHPNLANQLRVGNAPGGPPERFTLTPQERTAMVVFLQTLTDDALLSDPKFANPFTN